MKVNKARAKKALTYPILVFTSLILLTSVFISFQSRILAATSPIPTENSISNFNHHQPQERRDGLINSVPIARGDPAVNFWILEHLAWHDKHRANTKTRRVIFQTIGAGLGDHIKALVWAYGYAVLTRRLLVIDWQNPYPIESVISPLAVSRFIYRPQLDSVGKWERHGCEYNFKYGRGIPEYMLKLLARQDVHTVLLKIGPAQPPDSVRDVLLGSPRRFGARRVIPRFSWAARRTATRLLLEPSAEIRGRLAAFKRTHGICAYNEANCAGVGYYAVHARLGIGTGETHFARFSGMADRVSSIAHCFVDELEKRGVPEKATVLVASDTAAWRTSFRAAMRERMPDSRVIYYGSTPKHFRDIDKGSSAGRNSFLDQHTEMILIGNAIRTVAFRSGFPEVGFWRGYGRHYNVVDRKECAN